MGSPLPSANTKRLGPWTIFDTDKFKLNKNEQRTVLDFYRIIHILYMRDIGTIHHSIKLDGLLQLINEFRAKKDINNDYLTDNDSLEDYLKPLIHANEFINPKNTETCIVIICAVIKIYDEMAKLYKK